MKRAIRAGWARMIGLILIVMSASTYAFGADMAGSVSFIIGDANVAAGDGKSKAIARGDTVYVGQTLVTGPNGHIHLRMADGAFISVRPQSRLRIEEYRYDPAVPSNNRIKFVLEQGVARSITGKAGEAARENYRLNTPLAAIGIRGTDFVVQAAPDITRVTVQSGAVVMSPFGNDCLASTLGPCKSGTTRVLTAAMQNAYLELRSRNEAPLLVPAEKALESPNLVAPPRPEEPHASADKQSKTNSNIDTRDAIREVTVDTIKSRVDAAAADVPPPPPPKYWWGRYSNFVKADGEGSVASVLAPGRELTVGNEVFILVREAGDVTFMPNSGVAKFQLANSEAYFMKDPKTLSPAQVSGASLTVDFGARRFDTALTVNGDGYSPVGIQASGRVTGQGELKGDPNTGTTVMGSMSRFTDQAGYLFQRNLGGGLSVVGATRWTR